MVHRGIKITDQAHKCLVAFGSNQPFQELSTPLEVVLTTLPRVINLSHNALISVSALYQSDPVPPSDQPKFVNGCLSFHTFEAPETVLQGLLDIELDFGRKRTVPNAARTLDLDLIAYESVELTSDFLTLPHPRMHDRGFVLKPAADIWPEWQHPKLNQSLKQLLEPIDCSDLVAIRAPFRLSR